MRVVLLTFAIVLTIASPAIADEPSEEPSFIQLALNWIAAQQHDNGGWAHDPSNDAKTSVRATSLALLPFLAAGQTHRSGEYQKTVERGLGYLKTAGQATPKGLDLSDNGNAISQAWATLVLSEAYALSQDEPLKALAQKSADFLASTQHEGGGWRLDSTQEPDLETTMWAAFALRASHLAHLDVPRESVQELIAYLDDRASNDGATYSDAGGNPTILETQRGLLTRNAAQNWTTCQFAFFQGQQWVFHHQRPDSASQTFERTQLRAIVGGSDWRRWRDTLHQRLAAEQIRDDTPNRGSWSSPENSSERLEATVFSTLAMQLLRSEFPIVDCFQSDF